MKMANNPKILESAKKRRRDKTVSVSSLLLDLSEIVINTAVINSV